tara:strand:- start:122 stop:295 length:174 start_codon:yes stop_codon:yes gene_type:complete
MTQKERDVLKIRVGASRGAITMLACTLGPDRGEGIKNLAKDAIKNLNLACDILESKT